MTTPCKIPCDCCGAKSAHWFGGTSVAICDKPECRQQAAYNWQRHCEEDDVDPHSAYEYGADVTENPHHDYP